MTQVTGIPLGIAYWEGHAAAPHRPLSIALDVNGTIKIASVNASSLSFATSLQGVEMVSVLQAAIVKKEPITVTVVLEEGSPPDAFYPSSSYRIAGIEVFGYKWSGRYFQ